MFNRFACFWPTCDLRGSLGKSHQNGDYLKQDSNLKPLDHRSTALPYELEKTSPHKLNFGYLNPATCFFCDFNNKLIMMFLI